jgi:hypothetical protein
LLDNQFESDKKGQPKLTFKAQLFTHHRSSGWRAFTPNAWTLR